jgi:hypothetical protein
MLSELEKLKELVEKTNLKQLSKIVKQNQSLADWIDSQTKNIITDNYTFKIWCILNNVTTNLCEISNKPKSYRNFSEGMGFCGKTNICECAKISVSQNVKKTSQLKTPEQKEASNKKREATVFAISGVTNNGQTKKAIQAHKEFYADEENVKKATERYKQTMTERYGKDNPYFVEQFKIKKETTLIEKYNVSNPMQNANIASKSIKTRKEQGVPSQVFIDNFNKIQERLSVERNLTINMKAEDWSGIKNIKTIPVTCQICNTPFDYSYHGRGTTCRICNPLEYKYRSKAEIAIFEFIETLGLIPDACDRSLINPYELDIVIHSHKIAIEYCGLYWHSELNGKDKKYHKNKMELANEKGYRLITIFEDEWLHSQEIVKSRLIHILGLQTNKIGARQLSVKPIKGTEAKIFFDKNHIQGFVSGQLYIALIDNKNEIYSCMSCNSLRKSLGQNTEENSWELTRFANKLNVSVIGAASKLFKAFLKQYNPKLVISYADLRWSEGNLYNTLGFITNRKPTIGYHYMNNYTKRYHRYKFRKSMLVKEGWNAELTEWEIMQHMGYDRIWDCGVQRFDFICQ